MGILKHKRRPSTEIELRKSAYNTNYWHVYEADYQKLLPLELVKENNRGWTFHNYTITGNRTVFFFSRGDWEMIEE